MKFLLQFPHFYFITRCRPPLDAKSILAISGPINHDYFSISRLCCGYCSLQEKNLRNSYCFDISQLNWYMSRFCIIKQNRYRITIGVKYLQQVVGGLYFHFLHILNATIVLVVLFEITTEYIDQTSQIFQ